MTIPQRILLHVTVGAGLAIALASAATYFIVYRAATDRELKHLETYVSERAQREEAGFRQVEANLVLVRGQFLKRIDAPIPANYETQWNQRFALFPDGSWRSRTNFTDGRRYSTLWAHKNVTFTPELKTMVLRAQNICDDLLPGWVEAFPSVYFVLPGWLNIGFDPRLPSWVWDTPADYDPSALEWFQLSMATNRPGGAVAWSGVIEEPTSKVPIVSVYLPIEKQGRFLGSVGHDLFVNRLMEATEKSGLPGAVHVIFRRDGRLIAHPAKRKEILASVGQLRMQEDRDPALASLYRLVTSRGDRQFSGYDPVGECYFSVARLAGPDWYFVTTMPRDLLRRQAFQSAQWVLWSGLISLALLLGFLASTLRRQIARPLAELARATRQMGTGDTSARASIERQDELGALARSFNEMARRVSERDAALRAEKASLELRVSERTAELARFASIAEATGDFFGFADMEERILYINPAGRRLIGLAPDEPLERLKITDVHPAAAYALLSAVQIPTGLREGSCSGESQVRHRDGREIPVSLMLVIPRTDEGRPMFISAIMRDISARKEAEARLLESEARLRESEARFATAFRHSPAMQSLIRAGDGVLVEVNETFLRQLGFEAAEIVGKTAQELDFWVERSELDAYRKELASCGWVAGREVQLRGRDRRVLTVLLSTQPVDIGGTPHFLSAGVDITERKEAEARLRDGERLLRESEARLRALYEAVSAAVVVQDDSGFIQINPASLSLFGAERPEQILGRHPADFSPAIQPDGEPSGLAAQRHIECALSRGVHRFTWQACRLDRTEIPVEVTLTALQLGGRPVLQAVIIDLTERKRVEAELLKTLERERELGELKSSFVSLVSHEFRTPLEVIMSSADNLDRYHDRLPEEKRRQLLGTIQKSVRNMAGMMEEVLVLGRLETDRMSFHPAPLDVHAFCRRLCDEIDSATSGRCPIDLRLDGATERGTGDESLLRHVFTNLLSNAVKYSPPGQTVQFHVQREGAQAVCSVRDRGCGIPEADQARVFQAFHRGSNVGQIPGTGLGLLIVQRCVALHGGQIRFESTAGQGTTFTVLLPLFP